MRTASALVVLSTLAIAAPALAQSEQDQTIGGAPLDRWRVSLTPRIWYVAPAGDLRLPGSTGKVSLDDLDASNPRLSPSGEISLRSDDYRLTFRGMNTNQDVIRNAASAFNLGPVSVSAGDAIRTKLDMTVIELSGGYRFWAWEPTVGGVKSRDNHLDFWAVGGARVYDFSFDFARLSPTLSQTKKDVTFIDPFVGVRTEMQFARNYGAELEIAGGALPGSRSTFNFDITAGFQYKFCEHGQALIGYRLLISHLKSGKDTQQFRYDGSLAGLFFGVVVRF
jgi:hypothetical protein